MNVTLRRSVAVVALVLAPLASACSLETPTDKVYNPGQGVNDRSGQVDVLGTVVVAGKDGSGTLVAGLTNQDDNRGDALTQVQGSGRDSSVTADLAAPVQIKPGGAVNLAAQKPIVVKGQRIKPGNFVTLTLSFQNASSVTLDVPVVAHRGDYANVQVP